MDTITDLASQAVNYLTLVQDICRRYKTQEETDIRQEDYLWVAFGKIKGRVQNNEMPLDFQRRINELMWSGFPDNAQTAAIKKEAFLATTAGLLGWLAGIFYDSALPDGRKRPDLHVTPDYWRVQIKLILYIMPEERIRLVRAMQYMPVQVISALLGRNPELSDRRLYQFYFEVKADIAEVREAGILFSAKELGRITAFWKNPRQTRIIVNLIPEAIAEMNKGKKKPAAEDASSPDQPHDDAGLAQRFADFSLQRAALFLLEETPVLLYILNKRALTVPFISLFEQELSEIEELRRRRDAELEPADKKKFPLEATSSGIKYDPERKADEMQLAGLAFSGGGIRSATFNLGILQKLAELGALPRFDYLSTVSGGGYIGAWYTSWIYHARSVKKVNDRLNHNISSDPMAEEVRPIRWLRMFSNYLSPNASIMSADAWAAGITWLRNTLINQTILLLILVTALAAINASFAGWIHFVIKNPDFKKYILDASLWLMPLGVAAAACGMSTYNNLTAFAALRKLGASKWLPHILVGWAALSAAAVALCFLSETGFYYFGERFWLFLPSGWACLVGMLFIALIGGYHRRSEKDPRFSMHRIRLWLAITLSSVAAAIAFMGLMALSWQLIQWIKMTAEDGNIAVFIFGIPIILEAFVLTVIIRMVGMGKFFPDERREWWGRLGGMTHRFIFWWVIVALAALWFPHFFDCMAQKINLDNCLSLAGGWAGVVGIAVKMAYSSSESSGKSDTKGQQIKDVFIRMAPYLFMVGFLLIGASVFDSILDGISCLAPHIRYWQGWLVVALSALTLLLSWRAGVNEFSLHDFYRNRLVRAYMGGTRRRTDREISANRFTGFDKDDDFALALLQTKKSKEYAGPYPLLNTALNSTIVSELDRQDRMAESFVFSPLYCGFDFNPTRSSASMNNNIFNFGYRPTEQYSRERGPLLGTVMAISGAAVSPNMGYHSSPATSFLLTMFNLRLGSWIGNPRRFTWQRSDPGMGLGYLLSDLVGKSDIDNQYVYLSDGGHFDNMGLYELVRRRCTYIVLGDGEQDENATCEGLANAIRRCRIDFGVEIKINVAEVAERDAKQLSGAHLVRGTIAYPNSTREGTIIYIKTAITTEARKIADVREYHLQNPKFPQESTGDQFFNEAQFESYRKLGYESVKSPEEIKPELQPASTDPNAG